MDISIVIPSYNGGEKLPGLFKSLLQNDLTNVEVIVVLDGSTDDSDQVLSQIICPNLIIISQSNGGRSKARNKGVEIAKGHVIFFIDDDMELSPKTLAAHIYHHNSYPNTILVGKVSLDFSKLKKDFDFYIMGLLDKWEKDFQSKTVVNIENFKFTTQHLSIAKSLFHSIGGFDNRLTDAEDYDLAMRALLNKVIIYYDPEIIALHNDFPTCEKYIRRQIEYKNAHKKLELLDKKYGNNLFPSLKTPGLWRKIISHFFSKRYFIYLIDNEKFSFVPKRIRYKVYSEVIYSHTLKGLGLI